MLKTSNTELVQSRKGGVRVGDDSRAGHDGSELDEDEVDGGEVRDNEVGKKVQKPSKSKNLFKCIKSFKSKKTLGLSFFTSGASLGFTKLGQAFVKTAILHHFDSEYQISFEMDVSGYAIGGVFSQLTLDDGGRWHSVAFFSQKMIPAEIKYETHNGELLAIIKTFKTWKYHLEGS